MVVFTISYQDQDEDDERRLCDKRDAAEQGNSQIYDILLCQVSIAGLFLG